VLIFKITTYIQIIRVIIPDRSKYLIDDVGKVYITDFIQIGLYLNYLGFRRENK